MAESTCYIATSYEAKHIGVRTGTSAAQARQLCPEIIFVVAKHEVYVAFHQRAVTANDPGGGARPDNRSPR